MSEKKLEDTVEAIELEDAVQATEEEGKGSKEVVVEQEPHGSSEAKDSKGNGIISQDEVGAEESRAEVVEEDPLKKLEEENKKLREQMLRVAADFDNFRKRSRRESEEAGRRAKMDVLIDLLPVFDNMERAVAHGEKAKEVGAVVTGVQMVVKQFVDVLGKLGVERVKAVGEVFDPVVHEAIQQIESTEFATGTVVSEFLPGYRLGERLLRASMVIVAKAPPEPEVVEEVSGRGDGGMAEEGEREELEGQQEVGGVEECESEEQGESEEVIG